ncbi:hypothetical protein T484DRAFT_2588415 [Baffinella frigidus]|nr:hypothetical protein T484DRAFT_2588415 [Cryptophyta sp. CCMP2293]
MVSGAVSLTFVKSIKIAFSPIWAPPACREFITRISGRKAQASNPKCTVDVKVIPIDLYKETPPSIDVVYIDGTEATIVPAMTTKIDEIVEQVSSPTRGYPRTLFKCRVCTESVTCPPGKRANT